MNRRDAQTPTGQGEASSTSAPPCPGGPDDWLVWQLADSAFPTGGFAHSGGLEAACQHGAVRGGTELSGFLRVALTQLVYSALPFVHAAFTGAGRFEDLDRTCDAFLANHVTNRASRLQGQAFLAAAENAFAIPAVTRFRDELRNAGWPGHLAPVFGCVAQRLQLGADTTARLFVFLHLRSWISAAVRLNVVGPLEGQRLQHGLGPEAGRAAARFGAATVDEAAQTAPALELWQGAQDRLYSRLFQT